MILPVWDQWDVHLTGWISWPNWHELRVGWWMVIEWYRSKRWKMSSMSPNVSTVGYEVVLFQVVSRRRQEQKSKVETKDKTDEAGNPRKGPEGCKVIRKKRNLKEFDIVQWLFSQIWIVFRAFFGDTLGVHIFLVEGFTAENPKNPQEPNIFVSRLDRSLSTWRPPLLWSQKHGPSGLARPCWVEVMRFESCLLFVMLMSPVFVEQNCDPLFNFGNFGSSIPCW